MNPFESFIGRPLDIHVLEQRPTPRVPAATGQLPSNKFKAFADAVRTPLYKHGVEMKT